MLCERCRDKIEQGIPLPRDFAGPVWLVNGEERVAPAIVRRIFKVLWSRKGLLVSREGLENILYGTRNDPPGPRTINTHICRLRGLLIGSAYTISTFYCQGWRLDPRALEGEQYPKIKEAQQRRGRRQREQRKAVVGASRLNGPANP